MTSLPRISILVPLHNAEGHILQGKLKDIPRRYFHHTKLKDIWQNFLLHHYSIRKIVQDYQHRRKS